MTSLRRVLASSGNVKTAVVLSGTYLYACLQARSRHLGSTIERDPAGGGSPPSSLRSWLASSALARHIMRFRMGDGSRVRCRILDSGGLLSVHADRDYDIPGVDWSQLRTIVDVGAHVGSFTIWAGKRAPQARLLAIEPNPETVRLLSQNVRDNSLQDRVTIVNAAVGAASGVGRLELVEHSLGTRLARSGVGPIPVRVGTVEQLLVEAGVQELDILKIDCEGMEYEVFDSLDPEQLRLIRTIMCEYHPDPGHDVSQLDAILRAAGFKVDRPSTPVGVIWATR